MENKILDLSFDFLKIIDPINIGQAIISPALNEKLLLNVSDLPALKEFL
jgi:hypothetical protein